MIFVVEVALWWGATVTAWVCTLSSVTWPELTIAATAGLPCAVLTRRARRALEEKWRPGMRLLQWTAVLPLAVVTDTIRVLGLPPTAARARPRKRQLLNVPLPAGGPDSRAATRRAEATVVVSATPATFVMDSRPEDNTLIVHRLVAGAPQMTELVQR